LTAQTPPTALHCREVRQTSEFAQSASVAAMQAFNESEHWPANAHCDDLRQSFPSRATQRPLSA
jgi:hypothetical protein